MNEKTQEYDDKWFSIIDDNNVPSERRKFSDANYQDNFEKWMKQRGKAGWWAYQHGIGMYARKRPEDRNDDIAMQKARARYMGQESWYDEDNYFWIKIDEYPKPLLCQLRVSNHITDFDSLYKTHSHDPLGIVNCDTIFNLKIDPNTRDANKFVSTNAKHRLISVEATFDPDNASKEEIKFVDNFIKRVQSGSQPLITMDQIKTWIDPNADVRFDGADNVRPNQFLPRKNLIASQWDSPRNQRRFRRLTIPAWSFRFPKSVKYEELNVDEGSPFVLNHDTWYPGRYNDYKILVNYDKWYIRILKKNGEINQNISPIPILNESFNISSNYLHNIIMESIEKLLF